jgi:sugar phosphate isomerase/epimerase
MRLGRDYTNCLAFDYLTEEEKLDVIYGRVDLSSLSAISLARAKMDVERQIEMTQELGFHHVELDADPPNPYLEFDSSRRRVILEAAESHGITLSLHLPYSYTGGSVCCPQEDDRAVAVELHKKCVKFASDIGARYVTMHPGSVPPYHRIGKYRELAEKALIRSLIEVGSFARDLGLVLCLENNTAFDDVFSEPEDCLRVIEEARGHDVDVYLNFDIGHWFTRLDVGKPVPEPPENVISSLPPNVLKELHLNDYVPGERMFHPPLHLEWGLLKRGNLERYARIVKQKGVEVIVLETAMKSIGQVLERYELLKAESQYILDIFG